MAPLGPAITAAHGRPKAIDIASAHTLSHEPVLLAGLQHQALHDFGGFGKDAARLAKA